MREDWPERPEMEDMRRLVELYARGHLAADALTRETRRQAFTVNVMLPLRRWLATWRTQHGRGPESRAETRIPTSPDEARRPASVAAPRLSSAG